MVFSIGVTTTTYLGVENVQLLFTEFLNFHRSYVICCEVGKDLRISPRSVKWLTSG